MIYLAKMKNPFVVKLDTSLNTRKVPYFQKRGELKEKQGDYQGALDDYDKAIVIDDKNPIFYVLKAGVYEKLRNPQMAFACFDKALSINPDFSDAYINRALFYRHQRRYELSQKNYERALSLEPCSFYITGFNEEDVFKYGKLKNVIDAEWAELVSPVFCEGTLIIEVCFSPNKGKETDSSIYMDPQKMPYYYFRKKYRNPILNMRFLKFEFLLAKCIFYIRFYILRSQIKYVNSAVLN